MNKRKLPFSLLLFFVLIAVSSILFAGEITYLNRSPKALLMGDAFTAIADDEFTLFYNPAAMGRHSGLTLAPINPSIGITNALGESDRYEDFPDNDTVGIANRIMGFPIHLSAGATPSLKLENFGLAGFVNSTTNVVLRNKTHPSLNMDYHLDKGFVTGFALSTGRKAKKGSKTASGHQSSIGFGVKYVKREGLKESFDLFGTELLDIIDNDSKDIHSVRRQLGYSRGKAWGFDIGAEHVVRRGNSQLVLGASALDIGDTRFRYVDGARKVGQQDMSVNLGAAWSQDFFLFDYKLAFDLHPINQPIDFGRKVHIGLDVGILKFIHVLAGWNAGYLSYGATIDILFMKLYAGLYSVELGSRFKQEEGKRGILYLSLLDFEFDI